MKLVLSLNILPQIWAFYEGARNMCNNREYFWHLLWSARALFVICWPVGLSVALWIQVYAGQDGAGTISLFCLGCWVFWLTWHRNVEHLKWKDLNYEVREGKVNWNIWCHKWGHLHSNNIYKCKLRQIVTSVSPLSYCAKVFRCMLWPSIVHHSAYENSALVFQMDCHMY
jgi:hypothetical protein